MDRRLRALGHTLESICEALADAGLIVSKTTVQRERAKLSRAPQPQESAEA